MNSWESILTNVGGTFPNTVAQNASGPSATDGTEWVAALINNGLFGWTQYLLDRAGLTPNAVVESASASQIFEAMQKSFSGMPAGIVLEWHLASSPSGFGANALELNGQGIVRANYPELDANCYVGDGNNAAVAAAGGGYYRATDAAGLTPSITGAYLILPDTRGYAPRGLDLAASIDPDGASRYLGDNQIDATMRITGEGDENWAVASISGSTGVFSIAGTATSKRISPASASGVALTFDNANSTSPNPAKTDDVETRMSNFATQFVITY